MAFQKGENPHHPAPGSILTVEPIRDRKAIERIRKLLRDHPRDLCLFAVGINTAFRANELLSLKVGQVRLLQAGDLRSRSTEPWSRRSHNTSKPIPSLMMRRCFRASAGV
jgi:integrase